MQSWAKYVAYTGSMLLGLEIVHHTVKRLIRTRR